MAGQEMYKISLEHLVAPIPRKLNLNRMVKRPRKQPEVAPNGPEMDNQSSSKDITWNGLKHIIRA